MNVPATRPQQEQGVVIKTPKELREHILGVIANPKYANHFNGLLDRKAVFLAMMKISENPALVACDPPTIINALTQAGAFGWTCDPITGHAFLVPFGKTATLMPGYRGLMDLVHRAGEARIMAEIVFYGDKYEFRGPYDRPIHVQSTDVDRRKKPLTHVYAIATFKDRSVRCWEMTKQECIEHRNAYAKAYRGKESDLWHENNRAFPAMCRKTVLIRAIKSGEVPISIEARGQKLEYISEDDVPQNLGAVTFESPAGFDDPLHTEPQAPYSVDSTADHVCDGEPPLGEQTPSPPGGELPIGCEVELSRCETWADADKCVAAWMQNAKPEDVPHIKIAGDKRKAEIKATRGERSNTKRQLPGE